MTPQQHAAPMFSANSLSPEAASKEGTSNSKSIRTTPRRKAHEIVAGGASIKSDKVSAPADGHQDAEMSYGTKESDD